MKYRPTIFSSESVNGILQNRKTKTRRVILPQPYDWCKHVLPAPVEGYGTEGDWIQSTGANDHYKLLGLGAKCPYGVVGDRLWVRETFCIERVDEFQMIVWKADKCAHYLERRHLGVEFAEQKRNILSTEMSGEPFYLSSDFQPKDGWKSPRFMPRWASRITLEIMDIRAERLQDITNADIKAEGITAHHPVRLKDQVPTSRSAFARHWDNLNKKRGYGWDKDPWVWVVSFVKINEAIP